MQNKAWNWNKFFVESNGSDLSTLTQTSLVLERKFLKSGDVNLLSFTLNVLTLWENRLNVDWFYWAWLKSPLTLMTNLFNVRPILFLEFCTIWLFISGPLRNGPLDAIPKVPKCCKRYKGNAAELSWDTSTKPSVCVQCRANALASWRLRLFSLLYLICNICF